MLLAMIYLTWCAMLWCIIYYIYYYYLLCSLLYTSHHVSPSIHYIWCIGGMVCIPSIPAPRIPYLDSLRSNRHERPKGARYVSSAPPMLWASSSLRYNICYAFFLFFIIYIKRRYAACYVMLAYDMLRAMLLCYYVMIVIHGVHALHTL